MSPSRRRDRPEASDDATPAVPATIGARGATSVGVASLVAAGSGYVILVITARTLQPAQNAEFLTFWGLLFFVFGVLGGLQNEATRSVHLAHGLGVPAAGGPDAESAGTTPRVVAVGLAVGGIVAAVVVASGAWWGPRVLGAHPWPLLVLVAVASLAFSGHSATAGVLAGTGRWNTYARLVGAESTVRLLLVGGVGLLGAHKVGFAAATATAAATWLLLMAFAPDVRSAASVRTGVAGQVFAVRGAQAMLATAASAAIVVGFPVLFRIATTPADSSGSAPLLLAVQMTRAPLMIPLMAYQGVAITYFLAHRDRGSAPLVRLGSIVLAVGAVGAALAALLGPWLMTVFFGAAYDIASATLAGLTLGAAFLGVLTLTGAAALAMGEHASYAAGWVAATVVTVTLMFVNAPVEPRTVVALSAGPAVGVLWHLLTIHRRGSGPR